VVAQIRKSLQDRDLDEFYAEHRNKPFFNALKEYVGSGEVIILILRSDEPGAQDRLKKDVIGATDGTQAGTIRYNRVNNVSRGSINIQENKIHSSGASKEGAPLGNASALKNAARELSIVLTKEEKETYFDLSTGRLRANTVPATLDSSRWFGKWFGRRAFTDAVDELFVAPFAELGDFSALLRLFIADRAEFEKGEAIRQFYVKHGYADESVDIVQLLKDPQFVLFYHGMLNIVNQASTARFRRITLILEHFLYNLAASLSSGRILPMTLPSRSALQRGGALEMEIAGSPVSPDRFIQVSTDRAAVLVLEALRPSGWQQIEIIETRPGEENEFLMSSGVLPFEVNKVRIRALWAEGEGEFKLQHRLSDKSMSGARYVSGDTPLKNILSIRRFSNIPEGGYQENPINIFEVFLPQMGTSGFRTDIADFTDLQIYATMRATIQYLKQKGAIGDETLPIPLAGDRRPVTKRVLRALAMAIEDEGLKYEYLGRIPTPAVTLYGLDKWLMSVMATVSHNPIEQQGAKSNQGGQFRGELLRADILVIQKISNELIGKLVNETVSASSFDRHGMIRTDDAVLGRKVEKYAEIFGDHTGNPAGAKMFRKRYADGFRGRGETLVRENGVPLNIVMWRYMAVAFNNDLGPDILRDAGADVTVVGNDDIFMPIDTEALTGDHLHMFLQLLEKERSRQAKPIDALVTFDGDSDRPLLIAVEDKTAEQIAQDRAIAQTEYDDNLKAGMSPLEAEHLRYARLSPLSIRFIPGDFLVAMTAHYLNADVLSIPVSAHPAISRLARKWGMQMIRTRIGSPEVVEGALKLQQKYEGQHTGKRAATVGGERNGGTMISDIYDEKGLRFAGLMTRDSVLPILANLRLVAKTKGETLMGLYRDFTERIISGLIDYDGDPRQVTAAVSTYARPFGYYNTMTFDYDNNVIKWSDENGNVQETPLDGWNKHLTLGGQAEKAVFKPTEIILYDKSGGVIKTFDRLAPNDLGWVNEYLKYKALVDVMQADFDGDNIVLKNGLDQVMKTLPASSAEAAWYVALSGRLKELFPDSEGFQQISAINFMDGVQITFRNGEICHLRPSGNAAQMRIYCYAATLGRANAIVQRATASKEDGGTLHRFIGLIGDLSASGRAPASLPSSRWFGKLFGRNAVTNTIDQLLVAPFRELGRFSTLLSLFVTDRAGYERAVKNFFVEHGYAPDKVKISGDMRIRYKYMMFSTELNTIVARAAGARIPLLALYWGHLKYNLSRAGRKLPMTITRRTPFNEQLDSNMEDKQAQTDALLGREDAVVAEKLAPAENNLRKPQESVFIGVPLDHSKELKELAAQVQQIIKDVLGDVQAPDDRGFTAKAQYMQPGQVHSTQAGSLPLEKVTANQVETFGKIMASIRAAGLEPWGYEIVGAQLMPNFSVVIQLRTRAGQIEAIRAAAGAQIRENGLQAECIVIDINHVSLAYIYGATPAQLREINDRLKKFSAEFRQKPVRERTVSADKVAYFYNRNKVMLTGETRLIDLSVKRTEPALQPQRNVIGAQVASAPENTGAATDLRGLNARLKEKIDAMEATGVEVNARPGKTPRTIGCKFVAKIEGRPGAEAINIFAVTTGPGRAVRSHDPVAILQMSKNDRHAGAVEIIVDLRAVVLGRAKFDLSGQGLGTVVYRAVYEALDNGAELENTAVNEETRRQLYSWCYYDKTTGKMRTRLTAAELEGTVSLKNREAEILSRGENANDIEIVNALPGSSAQVSLAYIVALTVLGKLNTAAGFSAITIENDHENNPARSSGLDTLRGILSGEGKTIADSFMIYARKQGPSQGAAKLPSTRGPARKAVLALPAAPAKAPSAEAIAPADRMVSSIIDLLKPLTIFAAIKKVQDRYASPEKNNLELLNKDNGTIYHVTPNVTPEIIRHAAYGNSAGSSNIIVAPYTEGMPGATLLGNITVKGRDNVERAAAVYTANASARGSEAAAIYISVPENVSLGSCAQALFNQIVNKNMIDILATSANLKALVVVTDKDTFEGIRSYGTDNGAVYIVEGSRSVKWEEAQSADRVIEGIYGRDPAAMLGIYGDALVQKKDEGFVKGMELILGVNWKLAFNNPEALAAMLSVIGAGNIRLTGITDDVNAQALAGVFDVIKRSNPNTRVMRDLKVAKGEDPAKVREKVLSMLARNASEKGLKFDGIELNLSDVSFGAGWNAAEWLNSISEACADTVVITAILPKGMTAAAVSRDLRPNVDITEEFGRSDGGANKCVKVTIKSGFNGPMDIREKIGQGQGQMFEVSFEEGVVLNGDMLSRIAEGLKGMLRENASMVYEVSRNYPSFPSRAVVEKARLILAGHSIDLNGTDFAAAVKGLDERQLDAFFAELIAFGKDAGAAEQNSPFFDKLITLLSDHSSAPGARKETAAKITALIRGAGEAALVKDYLVRRSRRGFESDTDRQKFGQILWAFESVRDAEYNTAEDAAKAVRAMAALGETESAQKLYGKFLALAQGSSAAVADKYAVENLQLMKLLGNTIDSVTISRIAGKATGDADIVRFYNLAGAGAGVDISAVIERGVARIDSMNADELGAFAEAVVNYGGYSYGETVETLVRIKTRLAVISEPGNPLALVGQFRVLDLLSDERMKLEARKKKSVLNVQSFGAVLGNG